MRRNLYDKNCENFIQALMNLKWRQVNLHDKSERQFRKNSYHLIVKKHSRGYYCVMHVDRFIHGTHIHQRPITRGKELTVAFQNIVAEYKHLRGTLQSPKPGNIRQ